MAFVASSTFVQGRVQRSTSSEVTTTKMQQPDSYKYGDERLSATKERLEEMFKNAELVPDHTTGKTGECQCIFCNGTGQRKCSWCKGHGARKELLDLSWEQMQELFEDIKSGKKNPKKLETKAVICSACKGTTMLRCGYCQGEGKGSYGFAH